MPSDNEELFSHMLRGGLKTAWWLRLPQNGSMEGELLRLS